MVESNTVVYAPENGIFAYNNSHDSLIIGNTVQDTTSQHAIAVQDSERNSVSRNIVTGSGFHGIILNGANYSRVEGNKVSGHEYDGITITDSSNSNRIINNQVVSDGRVSGRSDGTGLWLNNESNGNYVFGNSLEGSVENGIAIFSSSNNFIEGNVITLNGHGGIYLYYDTSRGENDIPTNNFIHRNYSYGNTANYQVQLRTADNTDIAYNYFFGQAYVNVGGVKLETATTADIYENIMKDMNYGEYVDENSTGIEVFRNIHLDIGEILALTPANVSFDASVSLGGNYWSDHSVSGNPSRTSPYSDIIYDDDTRATGSYEDEYPFAKETLGRQYSMTVEEPLSGMKVGVGNIKTIRWTSTASILVDIFYTSVKTGSSGYIVQNYADVGYYKWEVPSLTASDDYIITVTCKDSNGSTVGVEGSTSEFAVTSDGVNDLMLLSPGRGQMTTAASSFRVAWLKTGSDDTDPVSVYLMYDNGPWTLYASGVTKSYVDITLPAISSNQAAVYVTNDSAGTADSTDGYFTIRDSTYSFVSPAENDKWQIGSRQNIEWISPSTSYLVDIDLYEGRDWYNVATNLPDLGKYTWLIPDYCTNGAQLRLTFKDATGQSLGLETSVTFDVVYLTGTGVLVPRYRLFNYISKEHHFTTSANEYEVLGESSNWKQEGTSHQVYDAPYEAEGIKTVPYYRLYSQQTLRHLWTTNRYEYLTLRKFSFWRPEGPDGYIFPKDEAQVSGTTPLYRLRYGVKINDGPLHHWTTSENEYETLSTSLGWIQEGEVGYVVPNE